MDDPLLIIMMGCGMLCIFSLVLVVFFVITMVMVGKDSGDTGKEVSIKNYL